MYCIHCPTPDHGRLLRECSTTFPLEYRHIGGRSILSWRFPGQLYVGVNRYQLGHLLAGCRAGTTGIGTVVFAYLVAHLSTMVAHLRTCLPDRAVHRRVAHHEMGICCTYFGAIEQNANRVGIVGAFLEQAHGCIQADSVAI